MSTTPRGHYRIYKAETRRGHQVICPETPWRVYEQGDDEEISLHQAATWCAALSWLIRAWDMLDDRT